MLKFLTLCISGVMLGCIYGLIALGYGLIYKASGLMSFVQGDMLTLGAFLGLTFYSILGLPYWLSLLLTMLCAFAFGMLLEKGVIRRLLNKKIMPIYVVLATIAISYILQNGSQLILHAAHGSFRSCRKSAAASGVARKASMVCLADA